MIVMKSERIAGLRIFTHRDRYGNIIKVVYSHFVPIMEFKVESLVERRLAAVKLVEMKHCNKKNAAKICDFHRNTVAELLRIKGVFGTEGLFEDHRGPKAPHKYAGKVRDQILYLLRKHPDWKDQKVADQAAKDLGLSISRSAVARIRTKKEGRQRKPEKAELIEMARQADEIDRRNFDDRQMEFNFKWDKDIEQEVETCSKEAPLPANRETDQQLLEGLKSGRRFNFAGGLINHLYLDEIAFNELTSLFGEIEGLTFHDRDILSVLYHSAQLGISSIESLKLVNAGDLGLLIGKTRSPDKETMRVRLSVMAERNLSGELMDQLAVRLLKDQFIDPEVFFIDGHFLPYYGMHVIAKGYYTVRRLAMPGNELYAITDLKGRILFYLTESNEIDFRPIIQRCAGKLIEYGVRRPVLVFDRGGYGIHFFKELDAHADFVTWAKYIGDKTLAGIPEERFTLGMRFNDGRYLLSEEKRTVKESMHTARREGRKTPTSIDLRLVVLWNLDTNKRIGIYTNNTDKPLHDIAYYMLNRWGESENVFKELMSRFNLDYHPGYDIKELENQPLVDNPDISLVKKAIRILKKEISECEREILIIEGKEARKKDKRRQSTLLKIKKEIREKEEDIKAFEDKLSELPEKVSMIDLLKGKSMERSDLEKKRLYDLMQFLAYNARERLSELFAECYDDKRDVKQVLDMITRKAGYVKLSGGTLIVVLDWIENKKHCEAAQTFCRLLNAKKIKMAGSLPLKLSFHISKYPLNARPARA